MGNLTGVEPAKVTLDTVINKKVKMDKGLTFAGDKYSAGETTRPIFSLAG